VYRQRKIFAEEEKLAKKEGEGEEEPQPEAEGEGEKEPLPITQSEIDFAMKVLTFEDNEFDEF